MEGLWVAASLAEFETLCALRTEPVDLSVPGAERSHESEGWALHQALCRVLLIDSSPTRRDGLIAVIDEWQPVRLKCVEADAAVIDRNVMEALQALLPGAWPHWRIQVRVYRDFRAATLRDVGAASIGATDLLTYGRLGNLMVLP